MTARINRKVVCRILDELQYRKTQSNVNMVLNVLKYYRKWYRLL